jgi:outer membrane biosynthesis protein TonB
VGKSLFLSTALHGLVILFTWVGLPFFERDKIEVEDTIVVDLVEIAEVTAAPPPKPEPEPEPDPAPAPPEPEPAPAPPEPEPSPAPPPPPPEAPAPKPEQVAEAPPVPKVAAPPPKPTPPKKPEPPKKEDSFDQLVSLVKNLEQEVSKRPTPPQEPTEAEPDNRVRTLLNADRATLSERDAIRAHIENCWRIDPGKEGLQDLTADIKVSIQPDGSVRQAVIEDTARYFSDPPFRTFADSARAAVLSCSNIPISPQRYEIFKEIVFTFSPQGRLN